MTDRSPLVTVLMTAFNRERYIGDAIESVLSSTMRDFELIVVDDCSADSTAEIAREYEASDPRVRVILNETNLGDYANRNRAAGYARGEYLKYVDSDDVIYPHGLEVMVRCMNASPVAGLGLSAVPDAAGPYPRVLTSVEAYRENFFDHDLLGRAPGSAIIRRSAFTAVGGFSGRRQVGDHELWLKLARRFPVVKMPADLLWDRRHPDQEKHYDRVVEKIVMHEEVAIAALNADDCPLDGHERKAALARISNARTRKFWSILLKTGGLKDAREYRRNASISASVIVAHAWHRLLRSTKA